jgi:hypothetical protein
LLRILGAVAKTQAGHNKNQSIIASAHLLSGTKQEIYVLEMVRILEGE